MAVGTTVVTTKITRFARTRSLPAIKVSTNGFKEMERAMVAIGESKRIGDVIGIAAYYALRPTEQAAKMYAPEWSGLTVMSLARKRVVYRKSFTAWVGIAPRSKFGGMFKGRAHKPVRYSHIIQGKWGDPYLEQALDATTNAIKIRYAQKLDRQLVKEMAKVARKITKRISKVLS